MNNYYKYRYYVVFVLWYVAAIAVFVMLNGCSHMRVTPQFIGATVIHSYEAGREAGAEEMMDLLRKVADEYAEEEEYEKNYY